MGKPANLRELEKPLKALANRRLLAILQYLKRKKEAPVTEIAKEIKLSVKATSKHLLILSALGIIESNQRSLQVFYHLAEIQTPSVHPIISLL